MNTQTTFSFIPRTYLHFDLPVSRDVAEEIATDPSVVAAHAFYPFITYDVETQKIRKKQGGGIEWKKPKVRPISYAAHKDAHIFCHYANLLSEPYEVTLGARGLSDCVIAFRSLQGRSSIHFANEAFEFIKEAGNCSVLAADVSDFFGTLDHRHIKLSWRAILGKSTLPEDHFSVFQAITRYSHVSRTELCAKLDIDPENLKADGRRRFCTPRQFRELVRGNALCIANCSAKGIPQGSPISAMLANLYMLDFDTEMQAFVAKHGGLYRRYCDDILAVLPSTEMRETAESMMRTLLQQMKLEVHPDKTDRIEFTAVKGRLASARPLNYLGFTFDGVHKRIRPGSIASYYKKMRSGVGRARAIRYNASKRSGTWTPLRRKRLHILYSYLGRRNFIAYALKAARLMNDAGIKKQVKRHWKRLQKRISGTE